MKFKPSHVFTAGSLCSLLCVVTLVQAEPYTLTSRYATRSVLDGEYKVANNVWGASTNQWVSGDTTSTTWYVDHSDHNQTSVAAYPFIYKGIHFGESTGTVNSGFPVLVDEVVSAPFSWGIDTSDASGSWNAAFEAWFSLSGGTRPNAAELMIWTDYQGNVNPGGSYIATPTIGGLEWHLFHATGWSSWNHYIAYKLVSPAEGPVTYNLDLGDFIADSLNRGFLESTYYLDNMEAGFEIWSDGENLKTLSYSANVFVPESTTITFVTIGFLGFTICHRRRRSQPPSDKLLS